MQTVNETWKIVNDFPMYEVSNLGRVRKIGSYVIKKQCKSRGHFCTRLSKGKDDSHCVYVHRLIAIAFIPNLQNKPCINHKDGNKENNSISNLEWCTWSENNQHAIDTGLRGYRTGTNHAFAVFSNDDVLKIRDLHIHGATLLDIMNMFGRSRAAIYNIVKGISYKNVA